MRRVLRPPFYFLPGIVIAILTISGCQNQEANSITLDPVIPTIGLIETLPPSVSPTSPLLADSVTEAAPQTQILNTAIPSQVVDPLRFTLPTPGPLPVSAWRPPLYPVPWSLNKNDHFYFTRPIAADTVNWPLPHYRYAATNFGPNLPHTGVDIVTPIGTAVMATGPGDVIWAGFGLFTGGDDPDDPYGLAIAIRHDFGYKGESLYTIYAHLSVTNIVRGQHVETGDLIALSGDTGLVTAPHLHYEIRLGENIFYNSVNPELWMAPPQGWGVLVGNLTTTWGEKVELQRVRISSLENDMTWYVFSYGSMGTINSDPYYGENIVMSDLPAGTYEVQIPYLGRAYRFGVIVYPGAITYFNFQGFNGFNTFLPYEEPPSALPSLIP